MRVKMVPNEKTLDCFQNSIKDIQDKFRKSNLKTVLNAYVDIIKSIVRGLDKSQVIDDCVMLMENYRVKVDKMT